MKLTDLFLADLEREAESTRKALARVPEGRNDFKPHEKSMRLGYLAALVADLPSWIEFMVNDDEYSIVPPQGNEYGRGEPKTNNELLTMLESGVARSGSALRNATDDRLLETWRLKAFGQVVSEGPRHLMIRDGVLSHLAHHRGQLTVYLRLLEASVPAIYGPSADEDLF
jgi:uncharacterized damage-inducible protein DinB